MRKRWWALSALSVLLAGGAAFAVIEEPAFGMYACPSCYGFQQSGDGLYLDGEMSGKARDETLGMIAAATDRVTDFYGTFGGKPLIFVCVTDACDKRMKYRGAKAKAFGETYILVYSQGRSTMFLAHELSHIELAHRIGLSRVASNAIPAWFNEGLAVLISEDTRNFENSESGDPQCITPPDGPLPAGMYEWSRAMADRDRPLYAMAACAVIRWMQENNGREGALKTLDQVATGAAFKP